MQLGQLETVDGPGVSRGYRTLLYPTSSHSLTLLKLARLALVSANTLLGFFPTHGKVAGIFDTAVRRL